MFKDFSHLTMLNHLLGIDDISSEDKALLIYEKILEEVLHLLIPNHLIVECWVLKEHEACRP